jgi:hypothetical protein
MFKASLASLCFADDRQGQGDTRLTIMPYFIPNDNYVMKQNPSW